MEQTAVVILNYNGKNYLEKFLPSVIEHSEGCSIIVADNCSTDDSVDFLKDKFPSIPLIQLSENLGFSEGYNAALQQVESKYYILLNSDVEVTAGWVNPIIEMMESDPSIAAAQPKILDYNNPEYFEYAGAGGGYIDRLGYPFCRGRMFLTLEKDQGQYDDVANIFWATGACLFIRSEVYHRLGGLDKDFFAHMEEIDLCWRIHNAGYEVIYNGQSKVYHVGGGTLHKSNPRKTYLNFRNGLTLLYKNYSLEALLLKLPLRILLDIVAAVKFMLSDSFADGIAVFKAILHFVLNIGNNTKKRRRVRMQAKRRSIDSIIKLFIVVEYYLKGRKSFTDLKR
ncbi:MAG: glycosyltransferase family 2 protein [Bacteroidota bacterium]